MKKVFFVLLVVIFSLQGNAQQNSRNDYISNYEDIAKKQMKKTGIPASIIMAQAVLESGGGNSELARTKNNHFGMKIPRTHYYKKYESVSDSYLDHSKRLKTGKVYKHLFSLDITDYEGWARGLKKSGYATDPRYPEKLIRVIKDYQLAKLDTAAIVESVLGIGLL